VAGDNLGPGDAEEPSGNGPLRGHGLLGKLGWALCSEPGDVRPHNEDFAGAYAPTVPDDAWDRGPLFVVCDGLGGHAAGEVASKTAVETALATWAAPHPSPPPQALRAAARAANLAIFDAALERKRRGMATTFTALTLAGRQAVIAHVGDSRCYLVRRGSCTQLTADHSRVGEMLRMGLLSPEQAAKHPGRSQLMRVVGAEPTVQVDIVRAGTEAGDVFVLCSDGLWDLVANHQFARLAGSVGTPGCPTVVEAAEQLVGLAIGAGAPDNVTVIVVKVTTDRPVPAVGARRSLFRRGSR
jgi:protein phosphatase